MNSSGTIHYCELKNRGIVVMNETSVTLKPKQIEGFKEKRIKKNEIMQYDR